MPLYEYKCMNCGQRFERVIRSNEPVKIECPDCGSERVQRLVSVFGRFGFSTPYSGNCSPPTGG
ncbi:MAG: zinc ribbon domain-containing protein [Chloroflexi bacterium]|nr:zinc ribbon domain-containing protein [Chloroflexota bacterium]MCL5074750.1 zinc ribbon domain-containing protein [Chloroflexota bacterium]